MKDDPFDNIPILNDLIETNPADQPDSTEVKLPTELLITNQFDLIDPDPEINDVDMIDFIDQDITPVRLPDIETDIETNPEDGMDFSIDIDPPLQSPTATIEELAAEISTQSDDQEMTPYLNQKIHTILQKHMDQAYKEIIEMLELE